MIACVYLFKYSHKLRIGGGACGQYKKKKISVFSFYSLSIILDIVCEVATCLISNERIQTRKQLWKF